MIQIEVGLKTLFTFHIVKQWEGESNILPCGLEIIFLLYVFNYLWIIKIWHQEF